MKTRLIPILLLAILCGAGPASAHLDALTSPEAGKTYVPGSMVIVKWGIPIKHNAQDLAYSTDGKTWVSIVKGLAPSVANYSWTVPQVASGTVRLRVCQLDGGAKECTNDHNTQSLDGFAIPGGKLYTAITGNFSISSGVAVRPDAPKHGTAISLEMAPKVVDLQGRQVAPADRRTPWAGVLLSR